MCVMLGMHSLEAGREYVVDLYENLHVFYWEDVIDNMDVDDDDLKKANADADANKKISQDRHYGAGKPKIPVDVAGGMRFRVED